MGAGTTQERTFSNEESELPGSEMAWGIAHIPYLRLVTGKRESVLQVRVQKATNAYGTESILANVESKIVMKARGDMGPFANTFPELLLK